MNTYIRVFLFLTAITILQSHQSSQLPDQYALTDIYHRIMVNQLAPRLNTTYLTKFESQLKNKYSGKIWGLNSRAVINLPVGLTRSDCPTQINVIFRVDIGSPLTTLTKQALNALYKNCPHAKKSGSLHSILIAGKQINVLQSRDHYKTINILGGNMMNLLNASLEFNYSESPQLRNMQLNLDVNRMTMKQEL